MRVIRVRAWAMRALWAFLALLGVLAAALLLLTEPERVPAGSPRRHLPVAYWEHRAYYSDRYARSGCVSPPTGLHEVQQAVAFWQRVTSEHERSVLVFAAYWDARVAPLVRLLVHSEDTTIKLRCLFWYYNIGDPVSVEASLPAQEVVSCAPPVSPSLDGLAAVSVVPADFLCGMTRNLLAIQNLPESEAETPRPEPDPRLEGARMGVCVVWWRGGDAAVRLVEWLQLLRYLGVHRVYLYINNNAHENVLRVVDYFSWQLNMENMTLDVMPYVSPPLSTSSPQTQARNGSPRSHPPDADFEEYSDDYNRVTGSDSKIEEDPVIRPDDLLPYNECVYRALGERLAWLALLDIDEVILPLRDGRWERLIAKESRAAKFSTDELPDVLDFQRWWFPEMLQTELTTTPPAAAPDSKHISSNKPADGPGRYASPAQPLAVPRGRIFEYKWCGPTARADASVASVRSLDVACLADCITRFVDRDVARVHLYTSRCGGASRGVCRALRSVSVRDDALWKWRRVQQEAAIALRRVQLRKHAHSDRDEE